MLYIKSKRFESTPKQGLLCRFQRILLQYFCVLRHPIYPTYASSFISDGAHRFVAVAVLGKNVPAAFVTESHIEAAKIMIEHLVET